jgi:hypothetical protein
MPPIMAPQRPSQFPPQVPHIPWASFWSLLAGRWTSRIWKGLSSAAMSGAAASEVASAVAALPSKVQVRFFISVYLQKRVYLPDLSV